MKKITILFAMLAMLFVGTTVEVVAQTLEVTTDPANPVYYTIKNFRSENYATYMGANAQLAQRNGITKAALWYFEASGDGYKLVNAVDGMKQATHSSATTDGATWYLKENPYKAGYTCVSLNSGLDGNCWDDQGNNGSIGYWHPEAADYEGTSWVIEKANTDDIQTALDDWSNGYTVNFSKAAGFTQNNRFTTFIKLGDQSITIPTKGQGTLAYRFISDQTFTATAGATIAPTIGYTGIWMHGFVFIDLNNDGSFTSDELVSYLNYDPNGPDGTGNALRSNNQTLPEFTLPTEAGTYRMRYMVDWQDNAANVNPGGTSDILSNRGVIYDVMLEVVSTKAALEAAIQSTTEEYNTLNNGATTVQIGYPTTAALEALQQAIADAQAVYDANEGGYDEAVEALAAALATAKSVENTNYTPRTDVYYTLTNANVPSGNRGSMVYDPSKDNETDGDGNNFLWFTTSLDKNDANHQWGFIEKDGKYFMYNVGKRQFAGVTTKAGTNTPFYSAGTWMFSNHPSSVTLDAGESNWVATPNVRVQATSEVTGNTYAMSISTSYHGPVITYDAVNDGGIPMAFAVATETQDQAVTTAIEALLEDLTPYREALQDAIDNANAMNANVGEGLNKYTVTSGMEALNQALADGQAEYLKPDAETSKTALVAAREAIETALANLVKTLNMPQAGMYRIKGKTSGKYLAAGLASNGKFNMTDAVDATTIFYYDGTKLVNYSDGKVNGMTASTWAWVYENGAVSTVEIQDGLTNGGYGIKSSTANFYDNGDGSASADRGKDVTIDANTNARYTNWYFEEVTELPITLRSTDNETFFATFSAPVNVEISGASLNTVTNNNKTAAYNTVNTNTLKAGVGVLLSGTSADATATIITDEVDEADYGLVSYYAATAGTGDESKLYLGKGKTSGKAGFYKLGESTTSNGFKAYLENSTEFGGAKEGFELEFAGVTGIDNMENGTLNMENGAVYNLQGQRVNKAQKGVFIQNGKKVVLK